MVRTWAPDDFWQTAQPLIPVPAKRPQGGGKRRADDRAVLAAIVYLVQAGCSWRNLPAQLFGVSRATTHRRFTEWTRSGLWERLHQQFLNQLGVIGEIDWSRAIVDSIAIRAEKGGPHRPKPGRPRQTGLEDPRPVRPSWATPDRPHLPGQTHDSHLMMPLLDSIAPIRSPRGRPRNRPDKLHADKAYDQRSLREEIRRRGIKVRIARKGIESSQRLGRHRWIVEACLSWLLRNRRLVRRYERKAEHFQAFADLACALLSYRRLLKVTN